jgi:hypothetical protein
VSHTSGPDDPHPSAPAAENISPAKAQSFEEGEIRNNELETIQSANEEEQTVKDKNEATVPILTISPFGSAPTDLSAATSPFFELGEIRDDQPEDIQTTDQKDEAVRMGKSEAAAPTTSANMTKNVVNANDPNSSTSGPSPSGFRALNQLASASKGLSYANKEWSKSGHNSLDDYLKDMRMNAKVRTPITYPNEIDLNSTPSEWLRPNSIPYATHSFALTQANAPNFGQFPTNANTQQPLLLLEASQGSRGVEKRKWAGSEDDNEM